MPAAPFICLMYHDVAPSSSGTYTIGWPALREQLDRLRDDGYVVEGFGGLERRLEGGGWPRRYALVSFDDGYQSFLQAAEWLAERGMGATFFLTRNLCTGSTGFLDETGVRRLAGMAETGTHGLTHAPMSHLPAARLRAELVDGKRWLEDLTGREAGHMSAPGGYWSRRCQRVAVEAGYRLVGVSREWWNRADTVLASGLVNRVAIRSHFDARTVDRILSRDMLFYLWRGARHRLLVLPNAVRGRWMARPRPAVSGAGRAPSRVWYVFSQFPSPSETFAGSDIRALRGLGWAVRAVNLRRSHPRSRELLREWDLADLELDEQTPRKALAGGVAMLCRPGLLAFLLARICRDNWRSPIHMAKSLGVLPRTFQLLGELDADPPDVLHLFWGHYTVLLGLLVQRTHPEVRVTMFLGAYDLRTGYRTSGTLAQTADGVFTHARANLPFLARQGIDVGRVQVVYRGVDLERLRRRGVPKIPYRLVSVGRLVPEKGMREVIEAFARLREQWPQATLCVVGDGPERRALERCVRELGLDGVEFTGHLAHSRVFARLEEAEVLLFLSHEEHLPNVVKEAMAAGCACVVSRTTGIEELVPPGEAGWIVEPRDIAAAVAATHRLFSDPQLRQQFTTRASAHLHAHFDVTESMRRYGEVWQSCRADGAVRASSPPLATSAPAAGA